MTGREMNVSGQRPVCVDVCSLGQTIDEGRISAFKELISEDEEYGMNEVELVREPDNRNDPNAVKVCVKKSGNQVGYIERELAPTIGALLRDGYVCHAYAKCWAVAQEEGWEWRKREALPICIWLLPPDIDSGAYDEAYKKYKEVCSKKAEVIRRFDEEEDKGEQG